MREQYKNHNQETEAAFAIAVFLLNLLILLVIGGTFWLVYLAVNANREFNVFLRGALWH